MMLCPVGGCLLERIDSVIERAGRGGHRLRHLQERFGKYLTDTLRAIRMPLNSTHAIIGSFPEL
jgi:hypothetical protein